MPPSPGVELGVCVWIERSDCLLMLLRAGAHGAGTWSIPGGWMDHGETAEQTAVREVKEETDLDIVPSQRMGWATVADEQGRWITSLVIQGHLCDPMAEPKVIEPFKCPLIEWVPFALIESRPLFEPLRAYMTGRRGVDF